MPGSPEYRQRLPAAQQGLLPAARLARRGAPADCWTFGLSVQARTTRGGLTYVAPDGASLAAARAGGCCAGRADAQRALR